MQWAKISLPQEEQDSCFPSTQFPAKIITIGLKLIRTSRGIHLNRILSKMKSLEDSGHEAVELEGQLWKRTYGTLE